MATYFERRLIIKENGFTLQKAKSRRYLVETKMDPDNTDDITLLANTPTQTESLLHSLGLAAGGIRFASKMEHMYFNREAISTLNSGPPKLVDKFTYLNNSDSSSENEVNMRLGKMWTAIDRLSIIWKSNLSNKIKRDFFQAAVVSVLLYGCTTWTLPKRKEKKIDQNCTKRLQVILNKS